MISSSDYFVEMSFAPASTLLAPAEVVSFTERFVLPTLDSLQQLVGAGRILAGGASAGSTQLSFVVRATSPQEVEELVGALPLWSRAQTRLVPLSSFEQRAGLVRQRLSKLRDGLAASPVGPRP